MKRMDDKDLHRLLEQHAQGHLLSHWEQLDLKDKKQLASQVLQIDWDIFEKQRQLIRNPSRSSSPFKPFHEYDLAGKHKDADLGFSLIKEGKLGCLVVSGGQGTRLGFPGPKGMYPISPIHRKTLYQLLAEKAVAASEQAGTMLPLCFMTSKENHEETVRYFKKNHFFGMQKGQCRFFPQGGLPFLDKKGDLFLEGPAKIAAGPDGNAACVSHFVQSGIWDEWNKSGVKFLHYVPIDNPLADPYDKELLGYVVRNKADAALKCVLREDVNDSVGVIVEKEGKVGVVEYNEISTDEREARCKDGTLKHKLANISLFCFSMEFLKIASDSYSELPLHAAFKRVKRVNKNGIPEMTEKPEAWKFERFIFDVLAFANQVKTLVYPRERCYAPLKDKHGKNSPENVAMALSREDKNVFEEFTGQKSPEGPMEIPQSYRYPRPHNVS